MRKIDPNLTASIKEYGAPYLLRCEIEWLRARITTVSDNITRLDVGECGPRFAATYARHQSEKFTLENQLDFYNRLLAELT